MMKTPFGTLTFTGILALMTLGCVGIAVVGASSGSTEAAGFGITGIFLLGIPLGIALWVKSRFGGGGYGRSNDLRDAKIRERRALHAAEQDAQQMVNDAVAQAQVTAQRAVAEAHQRVASEQGKWV
ncbi:MAG: hypothetical protein KDB26_05715 [Microthrixaceae bacterium]|nr:hypothetical protein [Microthrixaceae bacterium]